MRKNKTLYYFSDTDPRSAHYQRVLDMPDMDWWSVCLRIFLPGALLAGLYQLMRVCGWHRWAWIITLVCWSGYSALRLKSMLLTLVRLYQRLCPKKIRMRCRYEPSCSQYMILAVEKYGPLPGMRKGIGRLCRCNDRGDGMRGGYDEP